jgi:xylulokinase
VSARSGGAASVTENIAYNYLGSSSWIAYTAKQPVFDSQMRTFNWAHLVPGLYSPTGTMQAAGNSLHFMKELFQDGLSGTAKERGCGVYQLIDELIAASPPGANGLLYLPYLLGERSPRWDPNARGAFIGLKMEHTKADLLRATVEGVLMNLDIILNIFRQEADITSVNIIGGLRRALR